MTDRITEAEPVPQRRGFLRALGLGTAAAAAVAVTPALAVEQAQEGTSRSDTVPHPQKESPAEMVRARYRETPHVQAFYRTNRY